MLDSYTLENLDKLRHLAASITASPAPSVGMPEVDQMIFTIPNAELWAGREEDSRPDWKGWGAESFRIAPGGTFWIADTAVFPNRLLQYNAQGELLQEISLVDWVVYAHALSIDQNRVWILDISAEQPRLVQLSSKREFSVQCGYSQRDHDPRWDVDRQRCLRPDLGR